MGLAGLLAPAALWLGLFFLAPLLLILAYSFGTSGVYGGITLGFNPSNYLKVLDPLYLEIVVRTLVIAVANTLLCLLIGYPLAYFIAFRGGRWKSTLILLVMIPFWTSLLLRAYAWVVILSGNGLANRALQFLGLTEEPLNLIFTTKAVMMGMVYSYLPFMILPLYAALEKFDVRLKEAAQDLGAGRWSTFWRVTFPLSMPGVIAGSILVFIPSAGEFVIPNLLGGARTVMMGNLIQQQFLNARDWAFGSALAVMLAALLLAAILFYVRRVGAERLEGV
ncbi:binding-protein-dependent transport systems inner membrane component [Rubrobacter xylanophilus DSM 9941]|uniref:Binding-protein-dependent transport systems inner membrane component n=1 Tax=Rubrobacter xylanophilus (strain DSM 9941 / JCM 11954 / NBRC 16129 / PRD-1) TaxID=266117 RepID=Q1AS04_RUBXD|nr:binding-protein-dependent transport systems inner membrane component [Rubrobacter xylanophilus DSM 9941]